ncbi:terminase [Bacillus sp. ISL-75]|uniref:XkdF-like putative serine protease domain-containing protein n=1 Tax=Bacillus sp. ISL-75 TaxID=2819137 RepID=UPI001BE71163|nr:XkdF-like putative serine protease domain-containing protein [Bacillus sp. ISL-75]MBT2727846.1 terminase [Bacillus sp. ISL-75]
MARELKNANITHVSYVDKGANQKKFFLTKSASTPTFQKEVKIITKADDEQQLVYGVVYEPDVEDAHGDSMTIDEIEKSAHKFLKDFRNIDTQHDFEAGAGELVESYIAPVEMDIDGEIITKGSWVIVTKATEEIWESIKKGEFTGYSMAGTAEAIEKQTSPVAKSEDEVKGFFNAMKAFFSGEKIQKGAVRDKYEANKQTRDFWAARESFDSVIRSYNWRTDNYEFEADETKAREALQEYSDILQEILLSNSIAKALGKPPEEIQKAGKKISSARMDKINAAFDALQELKNEVDEEEVDVKKEELMELVKEAMSPITQKLERLEKDLKGTEEKVEKTGEKTDAVSEDLKKELADVIKAAMAPVEQRLETVEKARGISKAQEQEEIKKEESGSVWDGLL